MTNWLPLESLTFYRHVLVPSISSTIRNTVSCRWEPMDRWGSTPNWLYFKPKEIWKKKILRREIHLTQQLQQQVGSIDSYYMGFYIHSCPKMRYKGKLTGSFLLCPEAYTWHPLNDSKTLRLTIYCRHWFKLIPLPHIDILQRLNESKYQRLNDDQTVQDVHRFTVTDLDRIMILSRGRMLMTYPQFVEVTFFLLVIFSFYSCFRFAEIPEIDQLWRDFRVWATGWQIDRIENG